MFIAGINAPILKNRGELLHMEKISKISKLSASIMVFRTQKSAMRITVWIVPYQSGLFTRITKEKGK